MFDESSTEAAPRLQTTLYKNDTNAIKDFEGVRY